MGLFDFLDIFNVEGFKETGKPGSRVGTLQSGYFKASSTSDAKKLYESKYPGYRATKVSPTKKN
jgi:hypothetical protein